MKRLYVCFLALVVLVAVFTTFGCDLLSDNGPADPGDVSEISTSDSAKLAEGTHIFLHKVNVVNLAEDPRGPFGVCHEKESDIYVRHEGSYPQTLSGDVKATKWEFLYENGDTEVFITRQESERVDYDFWYSTDETYVVMISLVFGIMDHEHEFGVLAGDSPDFIAFEDVPANQVVYDMSRNMGIPEDDISFPHFGTGGMELKQMDIKPICSYQACVENEAKEKKDHRLVNGVNDPLASHDQSLCLYEKIPEPEKPKSPPPVATITPTPGCQGKITVDVYNYKGNCPQVDQIQIQNVSSSPQCWKSHVQVYFPCPEEGCIELFGAHEGEYLKECGETEGDETIDLNDIGFKVVEVKINGQTVWSE